MASPIAPQASNEPLGSRRALFVFFAVQVLGVTLLQKLGLPIGGDVMELGVFTGVLGAALLAVRRTLTLDPMRLLLFSLFALAAVASQLLGGQAFSLNSLLLALLLYGFLTLRFDVPRRFYERCMKVFLNIMLVVGVMVVVQQVMQLCFGWRSWLNLDQIAPQFLLFPGYNYLQPVSYGSPYFKPNAFVFLEVSFVSQFTALALLIELVFFQRLFRAAFYSGVLLICFAGTGLLLLAACAPFLISRLSPRAAIGALLVGAAVAGAALAVGWYDQVHGRFNELGAQGSSGYFRFNMPFQVAAEALSRPDSIFTGHGAGSTGAGQGQGVEGFLLVPFAKVIYEYGLITFILFYVFFTYCLFAAAPSRLIAWALFVFYNLGGGGFAVPVYVVACSALGTMLRLNPEGPAALRPASVQTLRSGALPVLSRLKIPAPSR